MAYRNIEDTRAASRRWYQRNRQQVIDQKNQRKQAIYQWFKEHKQTLQCERCGFDHPAALHFHHRNPIEKDICIAKAVNEGWSIKRIEKEISKCDILCANCHAIEHYAHS
jgi:hypothetical protein